MSIAEEFEFYKHEAGKVDFYRDKASMLYEELQYYKDLEEQGYKMMNIDKVIEQLEEESWSVGCSFAPKENRTAIIKTEKAIEIVKDGAK